MTAVLLVMIDYGSCHYPGWKTISISGKDLDDLDAKVMDIVSSMSEKYHVYSAILGDDVVVTDIPYWY